jgi:hypothetical protein
MEQEDIDPSFVVRVSLMVVQLLLVWWPARRRSFISSFPKSTFVTPNSIADERILIVTDQSKKDAVAESDDSDNRFAFP